MLATRQIFFLLTQISITMLRPRKSVVVHEKPRPLAKKTVRFVDEPQNIRSKPLLLSDDYRDSLMRKLRRQASDTFGIDSQADRV